MLTVIGAPMTRTMRVIWLLEELGEPYELDPAMPWSAPVLALNPEGKVPVVKQGDLVLTDSVAIMTWLADRAGRFTAPAGSEARAVQDGVVQFAIEQIETPLWTYAKHGFALPEKLRVPEVKPVCQKEFSRGLENFGRRLGENAFAAGEEFSIADILIAHCLLWAEFGPKWALPEGPVSDYLARMKARPAFAQAQSKAG